MNNNTPLKRLEIWLAEEKLSGAPNPCQAVLATATTEAIPHARVVAIREFSPQGLIFFTQKGTRKVEEIIKNPQGVITFWLELKQRQIVIEGKIEALTLAENDNYWRAYPKEAQIRFTAYAPTSGQPIPSKQFLENKRNDIASAYTDKELSMSPYYCGFRLIPHRFVFYAYCSPELSDVWEYQYQANEWLEKTLSP